MTRDQLRTRCLAYFLSHGVADLSLRPLAASIGTSARMLIHYFGSKEALIAEVMDQVRTKLQQLLQSIEAQPHHTLSSVMLAFWQATTTRRNLPYLRLLFEVQILALQNPDRYAAYLSTTTTSWNTLIKGMLPRGRDHAALSRLCICVIDGLVLDLLSTGDHRQTTRALHFFVGQLESNRRQPATPN